MTIALFITIRADVNTSVALNRYFQGAPLELLTGRSEVLSIDLFTPELGDVPTFTDGVGPPLVAQIDVATAGNAQSLVESPEFAQMIMHPSEIPTTVDRIELDAFETVYFPLPGDPDPLPRTASLSFMVRYYRPTDNEREFADYYMANHPPILATFPGIRNVLCYVPIDIEATRKFSGSGVFFGNEVVFDNLAALNNALASDARTRLRADFETFRSFGHNTHHAMLRERLFER